MAHIRETHGEHNWNKVSLLLGSVLEVQSQTARLWMYNFFLGTYHSGGGAWILITVRNTNSPTYILKISTSYFVLIIQFINADYKSGPQGTYICSKHLFWQSRGREWLPEWWLWSSCPGGIKVLIIENKHNSRSCPPHFTDQVEREKNHQETVNPMKYWAIISESERAVCFNI